MNDYAQASPAPPTHSQVRVQLPLSRPRWSYILLGANVLIWLAMTVAGLFQGLGLNGSQSTAILLSFGAQRNSLVSQGEYWRLFSSMFLHIGIMHLLFNSYALYVLGPEVERLYGGRRFLAIYLLSGLGGSLLFYLLGFYFSRGDVPSAGASGAIFGLIGVLVAYFWVHRDKFGKRGQQRLLNLVVVIGFNLFVGFTVPGINNLAHIGGLLFGGLLGWILVPDYVLPSLTGLAGGQAVTLQDQNSLQRRLPAVLAVVVALGLMGVAGTANWAGSTQAAFQQAREQLDTGDFPTAAATLRSLAVAEPDDELVFFYLGVAEANLGNSRAASQAWERSAALAPDIAGIHWNLALAYYDMGRRADALAELEVFQGLAETEADRERAEALRKEWSQP